MKRRYRHAFLIMLAAAVAASCTPKPQAPAKPAFYQNLAEAGAKLDEASARDMINAYRGNKGLEPVELDPQLSSAARAHARLLLAAARRGEAIRPQPGRGERLASAGYSGGGSREAVGAGYYTFAEAFSGWRDSPQHDVVMRFEAADRMGIAALYAPDTKYKVYWVLVMAEGG